MADCPLIGDHKMSKLTSAEFKALSQSLVGKKAGWEDRIANELKVSPNTIKAMMDRGPSASMSTHLKTACGLPDGFEPTKEDTEAYYKSVESKRQAEEEMGLWG